MLKNAVGLFEVLRWVGVAYLVWLGIQAWRHAGKEAEAPPLKRVHFWRGMFVALTNPKTIAFFTAFLPQFVDPSLAGGASIIRHVPHVYSHRLGLRFRLGDRIRPGARMVLEAGAREIARAPVGRGVDRRRHLAVAGAPSGLRLYFQVRLGEDAVEANDAAEMMEAEKTPDKFKQRAAVLIAVLAMLLAITSLGGNNATKEALNSNVLASNYFNFFQAKNMRQTAITLTADQIELAVLNDASIPDAAKEPLKKKLDGYRKTIARYESEPETGEGKKELLAKAKEYEKQRDHALKQDPYFDYAEALLQIAIVLDLGRHHRRDRLAGRDWRPARQSSARC